jgi:hypothetical protein
MMLYRGHSYRQVTAARLPRYLYHGTSLYRWNQIKAGGYITELLYLASSPSGTEMYRVNAVEEDEGDGIDQADNAEVLAQFDLEKLALSGDLLPDWDDVPTNMELFPDASYAGQVSWEDSLKRLGTCSFKGNLGKALLKVKVI